MCFTCRKQSVLQLVRWYAINGHWFIARCDYNLQRLHLCCDCKLFWDGNRPMFKHCNSRLLVRKFSLNIWTSLRPHRKIISVQKCIGTIFSIYGETPLLQRPMYEVPSKISPAKFSALAKYVRTCSVPISLIDGMIPCRLIDSSLPERSSRHRNHYCHFPMRPWVSFVHEAWLCTCLNQACCGVQLSLVSCLCQILPCT